MTGFATGRPGLPPHVQVDGMPMIGWPTSEYAFTIPLLLARATGPHLTGRESRRVIVSLRNAFRRRNAAAAISSRGSVPRPRPGLVGYRQTTGYRAGRR